MFISKEYTQSYIHAYKFLRPFAFISFILSIYFFIESSYFLINSNKSIGKVISIEKEFYKGSTTYRPTIEYTVKNRTYNFTSRTSVNMQKYKINNMIDILYNKNKPSQARINSIILLYLPFFTCFIVSLVVLPFYYVYKKSKNSESL